MSRTTSTRNHNGRRPDENPGRRGIPHGLLAAPGGVGLGKRESIRAAIARVLPDKGRPPASLSDEVPLGEEGLGLDSLDLATIVARLDAELGMDPFAGGGHMFRTVGEFIRLYESGDGE